MGSKVLAIAALAIILTAAMADSCTDQRLDDVKNRRTKIRGANLGSLFVAESWMAGYLWDQNGCDQNTVHGQYQLEQCLGGRAAEVLDNHWNTWVKESDFQRMSQIGVNAVRVPVGWWQIYDQWGGANNAHLNYYVTPSNYQVGSLKYLDRLLDWGAAYGIGILIDMHAAPGSQNGNDHSSPADIGKIYWDKYSANQDETVDSIGLFADRYATHKGLLGFCLLNEPIVDIPTLQNYYQNAYNRVRRSSPNSIIIINPLISPFQSGTEGEWTGFMNPPQFSNVMMSLHYYHCFGGPFDSNNPDSVIGYAGWDRKNQVNYYNQVNPKPMIIDEWSDCGVPANRARDLMQAQLNSYENAAGWTFWAWPNGWDNNEWSLQSAFNDGWIDSSRMAQTC